LFCGIQYTYSQYTVQGGIGTPYAENAQAGTGIEKVYFLNTLTDATLSYTSSAASVKFYKYTQSLSDAVLIPPSDITISGSTYTVHFLEDSKAYLVEVDGAKKAAVWIIDYAQHLPELHSITIHESDDRCENIKLVTDKTDRLVYYANNGSSIPVSRRYTITYSDLVWEQTTLNTGFVEKTKVIDVTGTDSNISAPLKNTVFTFSGDQYAGYLGILPQSIESEEYTAIASVAYIDTVVIQSESASGNWGDQDEGYTSPLEVEFYGYSNEPSTNYYRWYIYDSNNEEIFSYRGTSTRYTFTLEGTYKVILETANTNSGCSTFSDSIIFKIKDWKLDAPNFFSPDDTPGINDEFRVAYRSINKFKCTIFNRWGNKVYEWTDPSQGWDGKYNGRYVNTGVYFYVIEFETSRGEKKVLSGDINILRKK
jgi:gliding motility-associated-like protein